MRKRHLGAIATELRVITRLLGGGLQRAEELREARALWHVDLVRVRVRARVMVMVMVMVRVRFRVRDRVRVRAPARAPPPPRRPPMRAAAG